MKLITATTWLKLLLVPVAAVALFAATGCDDGGDDDIDVEGTTERTWDDTQRGAEDLGQDVERGAENLGEDMNEGLNELENDAEDLVNDNN